MIEFNIKELKPNASLQKNFLYRISQDRVVPICEKHEESNDTEIVYLNYSFEEEQYAILGHEYRNQHLAQRGCKTTDILTCLIDDENKKIYSLLLDIKQNISAFSDDLLKDNALLTVINEVDDFIKQLYYANLHKNSFLIYHMAEGYTEHLELGLATKRFEVEKFLKVAEFLENLLTLEKPTNMQPLVWYKFKTNLMPYVSEVNKIRNFANRLVNIGENPYPLQVYLLEKANDSEYAALIDVKH